MITGPDDVNEYHISSLFDVVQEGLLAEAVAPVVFALMVERHMLPGNVSVTGMALLQSSLTGGGGTSCTQKLKLM